MPDSFASQETVLNVEENSYLEYLPEPLIPFKGARLRQDTRICVAPGGSALFGEVIAPGRVARGEVLAYDYLQSRLTVSRPNDLHRRPPVYHESFRLEPRRRDPMLPVILGTVAAPTLGSLLFVSDRVDVPAMVDRLRRTAVTEFGNHAQLRVGITGLPGEAGVGAKVLGPETQLVKSVVDSLASEARQLLTGAALPTSRKY